MRKSAVIIGTLLVLGGTIWILQGLNVGFAPHSFMTGNSRWAFNGGATVLAVLALGIYGVRANH